MKKVALSIALLALSGMLHAGNMNSSGCAGSSCKPANPNNNCNNGQCGAQPNNVSNPPSNACTGSYCKPGCPDTNCSDDNCSKEKCCGDTCCPNPTPDPTSCCK